MFSDSGKIVPEFEAPRLRELQLPPFRIAYRRDEAVAMVVRVSRIERLIDADLPGNAKRTDRADFARGPGIIALELSGGVTSTEGEQQADPGCIVIRS